LGVHYLTFPDESGALMPLAFVVGEYPEVIEAEPNDKLRQHSFHGGSI
jgi:hypothetical protein